MARAACLTSLGATKDLDEIGASKGIALVVNESNMHDVSDLLMEN